MGSYGGKFLWWEEVIRSESCAVQSRPRRPIKLGKVKTWGSQRVRKCQSGYLPEIGLAGLHIRGSFRLAGERGGRNCMLRSGRATIRLRALRRRKG